MISRWELPYERSPLGLDALLFALAVALHSPLLLLHMKAPLKTTANQPRFVEVKLLEDIQIKIDKNPITVRPAAGPAITNPIELPKYRELLKRIQAERLNPNLPPIPALIPRVSPGIKPALGVKTKIENLEPKPLATKDPFKGPNAPKLGSGGAKLRAGSGGGIIAGTGRDLGAIGESAGPALANKWSFSVGAGQIASIGGSEGTIEGTINVGGGGGGGVVAIRTTSRAGADLTALEPEIKTDRGAFGGTGLPSGLGSPRPGGLGGAGAGAGGLSGTAIPIQRPAFIIMGDLKDRQLIYREKPDYPAMLRKRGVEGTVQLRFTVTSAGNVKDISIEKSSGYLEMNQAAIAALRKWAFVPLDRFEDQEGTIILTFALR